MERQEFKQAKTLHAAGNVEEAELLYRRFLDREPDDAEAIFTLANLLCERECLDEGVALYRRVLEILPQCFPAAFNLGNTLCRQDNPAKAADAYREALAVEPHSFDAWFNLGNALYGANRLEESETAYRKSLEIESKAVRAWSNLGRTLYAMEQPREAEDAYRKGLSLEPDQAMEHFHLADVLREQGWADEAVEHYQRALELDPEIVAARYWHGQMLYLIGRTEEAVALYREWLEREPDSPEAQHFLSAWTGDKRATDQKDEPSKANEQYVEHLFDKIAPHFDRQLQRLEYRAPELASQAIAAIHPIQDASLDILDAGCGTGLCAPLLRPWARSLIGVDLSPAMLEKARQRNLYDQLHQAELCSFMEGQLSTFDLIVMVDTLIFFGDLARVLHASRGALRPKGVMVLTLEKEKDGSKGYRLNGHGRFSHTVDYMSTQLVDAGFEPGPLAQDVLRQESGKPVQGLIVTARMNNPS